MRSQKSAYVFWIILVVLHSTASILNGNQEVESVAISGCLSMPDQDDTLFQSYQNHVNFLRQYTHGIEVQSVKFPVKKHADSDEVFFRKGLLTLRPNALGTVVLCHGYTNNKDETFFFKVLFPYFNVLAFDFRAHGELTDGQFSTIGRDEIYDVQGAVDFIRSYSNFDLAKKPIIGMGFSMGAVSLLQAQAEFQNLFDMLILDSPFDSSSDCMERSIDLMLKRQIFGRQYQLPFKKLLMKSLYSERWRPVVNKVFYAATGINPNKIPTKFVPVTPVEKVANITIPTFFIICENDNKVKVECVQRLYGGVNSPFKRLWVTQGIKHCGSCLTQPEEYFRKVNTFVLKVLKKDFTVPAKVRDDRILMPMESEK